MADDDAPPTGALLVVLPAASDPVNEVSEEDAAHCSVLWFGELAFLPPQQIDRIRLHAFEVAGRMPSFTAKVSGRAVIGEDNAGVLLLEAVELGQLRAALFDDEAVQSAYLNAKQFPHWLPHLTVSYEKGLPGVYEPGEVRFDCIGLWLAGQHEAFTLQDVATLGADEEEALLSAGLTIPPVLTAADLPLCVSYADSHPDARWYAEKRAVALGVQHMLPSQWAT